MNNTGRSSWSSEKTRRLVFLALWSAIIIFLAVTPSVGFITIGPISATTVHIPVIIGAIMLGPVDGAFLGLVFGITSLIHATLIPQVSSFLFSPFVSGSYKSVIIAIVPRVLIGVVAAYVFKLLNKFDKTQVFAGLAAGLAGSLTNTIFVMGSASFLFKDQLAKLLHVSASTIVKGIIIVISPNAIFEAVVAAVLGAAVSKALFVVMKRSRFRKA